ncbi:MAG: protein-export rane protein SecD [Frankiales bacterium]|nr:protein-export rane protein SecD [Frankiales bacterium]
MARPGPSRGQLHIGRYFIALLALFAALYASVAFGGKDGWLTPKLGLDLKGGASVTLTPKSANGRAPTQDQLTSAVAILRQRVDSSGVSEAEITVQGSTIEVSVPGGNRSSIDKVTQAAQMEFRKVISCQSIQASNGCTALPVTQYPAQLLQTASPSPSSGSASPKPSASVGVSTPKPSTTSNKRPISAALGTVGSPSPSPSPTTTAKTTAKATATPSASAPTAPALISGVAYTAASYDALNCGDPLARAGGATPIPAKEIVACDKDGFTKYHLAKAEVYGKDIKGATVQTDPLSGQVQVVLSFKGGGQDRWTQMTKDTVSATAPANQIGITLDGIVLTAPTTQSVINGDAQITGQFTQKSGQELANNLKFGALPLSFTAGQTNFTSPTLGDDQLNSGLLAGGIGLVAVVLYSLLYYRVLGFVTIASLGVSAGLVYASICVLGDQIGFALSLAGIAGFIVSVGITADSFVVFFERLKDEIREGRTPRSSVDRAWVRARRTIINADAVSFIAAVVLYFASIGAVRGFAFTLGLSTVLDLVVVFFFTRPLISWLSRFRFFSRSRLTGFYGPEGHDPITTPQRKSLAATTSPATEA